MARRPLLSERNTAKSKVRSKIETHRGLLTARQERFVQEYLIDLNAKQAAIRAGCNSRTAEPIASRLLRNIKVAAAVKQAQDERAARTKVTADMVIEELAKHAFGTMQDFFDPDDGHLLDVHEMSLAAKSRLAALDVVRERTRTSDGETVTTIEQTITLRLWDKIRALELLGQHLGMFKDKVDRGEEEIDEVLARFERQMDPRA